MVHNVGSITQPGLLMKILPILFSALVISGCMQKPVEQATIEPKAATTKTITSNTYVLAEPLPARKIRVSITARDKSIYIVNCNEHVVVALQKHDTGMLVWGGVSNACLSPSIIIPAKSTLSFIVDVSTGSQQPLDDGPYTLQLYGGVTGHDVRSTPIAIEWVTSNEFTLTP
jgi:hypothetical protein